MDLSRPAVPWRLVAEYAASRPRSQSLFERAGRVLPGGQTRSVTYYPPFPSVMADGAGYTLRDVDNHEYIDLLNNYTSLVHGNAFAPVTKAVTRALGRGSAFASIHQAQIELAEKITTRVKSAELVRFTNSGSEASALALRIARRFTGRTELVIASGGYHGAVLPFSDPELAPAVRITPFNDTDALAEAVTERTAAVFLEPFQGAGGVIVGQRDYLNQAQQIAAEHGALFVLDEVQSLRNSLGGTQSELGLHPDLTLLGKVIGGGFPIGVVCGRAELLETMSPLDPHPLSHAGTFNGHVTAAVAGSVTLDYLDRDAITTLNRRAEKLQRTIERAGMNAGVPTSVTRAGSILNVYNGRTPATSTEAMQQPLFHAALHLALMVEGVFTSTRGMINLSTRITDDLIDEVGRRYQAAFDRLATHSVSEEE